ncbi:uncharacterized protein LOC142169840 [Nicotiana tabacum]|uniref:Uncharacterized protein LOC142169840 n=1 Tax=Nicotiana tabacum TaxID=4097 RepID=A0AC58SSB5_TOBAC
MLHGKVPKIEHLKVFGCLCYASVLPRENKFVARAKRTVFMGYSETQKGYRLYDLESQLFFASRDMSFKEDIFPFKEKRHEDVWEDDLFLVDPIAHKDVPSANSEENFKHSPSIEHQNFNTCSINSEPAISDEQPQLETFTYIQTSGEQPDDSEVDSSRPSRVTKPPTWLNDYVIGKKSSASCKYPITNYVAYNHFSPTYQAYVGLVTTLTEPRSFKEAGQNEKWVEAMKQEISALEDNHT